MLQKRSQQYQMAVETNRVVSEEAESEDDDNVLDDENCFVSSSIWEEWVSVPVSVLSAFLLCLIEKLGYEVHLENVKKVRL